jgi:hypothetical protein
MHNLISSSLSKNKLNSYIDLIATLLVIGFTLLLHISSFKYTPFWVDELWRANLILNPNVINLYINYPDSFTGITPPLYLALNKFLATFEVSPQILRLSSIIPSVLTPGIAYLIIRKLNGDILSAILAGIFFTLNIELYTHSLQFKPYSLEIFTHLICVYFLIHLISKGNLKNQDYFIYSLVFILALLATMNIFFILPAIAITLFLNARLLNSKNNQFKTVLLFIGLLFFALFLYWFIWRFANNKDMQTYWVEGFNQGQAYPIFAYQKFREIFLGSITILGLSADGPFYIKITQSGVIGISIIFLLILSIFFAREKRLNLLWIVFIAILLVTTTFLNYLHLWPLGQFRSNIFINAYIILWMCSIVSLIKFRNISFMAILIIAGAIFIFSRTTIYQLKNTAINEQSDMVFRDFSIDGEVRNSIKYECVQGIKTKIYMNSSFSHAYKYFNTYDQYGKENWRFPNECVDIKIFTDQQFLIATTLLSADLKKDDSVWLLYSHIPLNEITALTDAINKQGTIRVWKPYSNAGYLHVQKNN